MREHKFSKGEALRFGWEALKDNLTFFIGALLIIAVIAGVSHVCQQAAMKKSAVIGGIIAIPFALLNMVLHMGFTRISLKICDSQKAVFSDLFSCYPLLIKYVLAALLYSIICLCGFVLLIIPGVIWAIKFSQYGYLIIDRGYGPIEALKRSALITYGAKWNLFLFGLILLGINLLGALCLMLGLFASIPTSMVAAAFVYRTLQKRVGNGLMPEFIV